MPKGTCSDPSCDRPANCRGLCTLHYQRARASGTLPVVRPHRKHQPQGSRCAVEGCGKKPHARGWCTSHYTQWTRSGSPHFVKRQQRAERYHAHGGHKRCSQCEQVKPVGDFFRNAPAPDGYMPWCKTCSMAAEKRRRQETPDLFRRRRREYYVANAERQRESAQRWRAANPDRVRETGREWYEKNRDARREYDRTRREARAKQGKAWRTPERSREFSARRRALKLGADRGDPAERSEYVGIIMNDPCAYCGGPAEHVDHIQPLTAGGSDAWENLAPACMSCNSRKHTRDLLSFLMVRERPSRREAQRARRQAS